MHIDWSRTKVTVKVSQEEPNKYDLVNLEMTRWFAAIRFNGEMLPEKQLVHANELANGHNEYVDKVLNQDAVASINGLATMNKYLIETIESIKTARVSEVSGIVDEALREVNLRKRG